MRTKFILLLIAVAYGIYKLISNFFYKRQNSSFANALDNEEDIEAYCEELYELCGKKDKQTNKLGEFDLVIEKVKSQLPNFGILRQIKIDDSKVLLLTRLVVKDNIHGSSLDYENIYDLDYLITFND